MGKRKLIDVVFEGVLTWEEIEVQGFQGRDENIPDPINIKAIQVLLEDLFNKTKGVMVKEYYVYKN